MQNRRSRVELEPDLVEPHVVVSINHPTLGIKTRFFKPSSLFVAVYDWIGSIAEKPKFFDLKNDGGILMQPDSPVQSGFYQLNPKESAVLMSPEGTVAFSGFGTISHNQSPPPVTDNYDEISKIREKEAEKFTNEVVVNVRSDNIYEDMLKAYRKRNVLKNKITISFIGENANGDGVSRDAFSAFFEAVYKRMEGCYEKVPSSDYDEEELEVLGQIITHAFVLYNIFPIKVSRVALKNFLFGSSTDNEILYSFMQYLPQMEADFVYKFRKEMDINIQPIRDILSDFKIFASPTPENVFNLMIKAGRAALIKNTCYPMQSFVKGLGNFWSKVTPDQFDALYYCTIPTADGVIGNLIVLEQTNQEGKIVTWLHRYIRSCTKDKLAKFLRFITGCEAFAPNSFIKLEFVDQPVEHLRPLSQTCFKILILSRQYSSFTQLSDNIDSYIENSENWVVHDTIHD